MRSLSFLPVFVAGDLSSAHPGVLAMLPVPATSYYAGNTYVHLPTMRLWHFALLTIDVSARKTNGEVSEIRPWIHGRRRKWNSTDDLRNAQVKVETKYCRVLYELCLCVVRYNTLNFHYRHLQTTLLIASSDQITTFDNKTSA
jgi:hypothetical protein